MTELRKKAIDTCNRALEVLIAAYTVLNKQRRLPRRNHRNRRLHRAGQISLRYPKNSCLYFLLIYRHINSDEAWRSPGHRR